MAERFYHLESFPEYDRHGPAVRLEIYDHIIYFSEAEVERFIGALTAALGKLRQLNEASPAEAARWLAGEEGEGEP